MVLQPSNCITGLPRDENLDQPLISEAEFSSRVHDASLQNTQFASSRPLCYAITVASL